MKTAQRKAKTMHTRWTTRQAVPAIVAAGLGSEAEQLAWLEQRDTVLMVAERGDVIEGQMVYRLEDATITLIQFAARTEAAATALLKKLAHKVESHRRAALVIELPAAWVTSDVRQLALGLDRVPGLVLTSALEDAGCDWQWLINGLMGDDELELVGQRPVVTMLAEAVLCGIPRAK